MPMENKAVVFNIQRFSVNDGPGIRTNVFLKGCMLDCIWCHNPESKSPRPVLSLTEKLCIGCGECVRACPKGLHGFENGVHTIDRANCIGCEACVEACGGALELLGKEMTVDEILAEVLRDKPFYDTSGGGMTVTGGDPLYRADFTRELLKAGKEAGLHTCIETSGYAKWEILESLLPYTDLFLWDVKETDSSLHQRFTGVENTLILENLHKLDAAGASVILRCPLIPGCNDRKEHLEAIATLANELKNVLRIDVEPYHPLGKGKCEAVGLSYPMGDLGMPAESTVQEWISAIAARTDVPVQKA